MRRVAAAFVAVVLARRLLLAGSGSAFEVPPDNYTMLYNGQNGDGIVKIGRATSTDAGLTWTRYGSNPIISPGAGGTWNDEQVHGPAYVWDGSQHVLYLGGYDGTNYRIGRWTSADLITWAAYGSNPVLGTGSGFDANGVVGPVVRYDPLLSPPWQMWYTGFDSGGVITGGYADSTDGLSWTRRGQVIALGSAGQFDDEGASPGGVYKLGSTYYLWEHGTAAANETRSGYITFTDPLGTYTKHGTIAQFAGQITSLDDGLTYRSNGFRHVILRGSTYVGYGTAFQPVTPTTQHEVSFRSTSTDLITWTTPTGVLLPLSVGAWDEISAENPQVVVTP